MAEPGRLGREAKPFKQQVALPSKEARGAEVLKVLSTRILDARSAVIPAWEGAGQAQKHSAHCWSMDWRGGGGEGGAL